MLPYYTKEVIPINRTIKRGELYYADLGQGVGSEQNGYRPVVIIQNDVGNKHSPTVIVAALSSDHGAKTRLPTHYTLSAESGLEAPSIILMEQLRTLDKRRLDKYIGKIDDRHLRGINRALSVSVGLIEPMPKNQTICLCGACARNFYGSGSYYLKRTSPAHAPKGICNYCNHRPGFDYTVIERNK